MYVLNSLTLDELERHFYIENDPRLVELLRQFNPGPPSENGGTAAALDSVKQLETLLVQLVGEVHSLFSSIPTLYEDLEGLGDQALRPLLDQFNSSRVRGAWYRAEERRKLLNFPSQTLGAAKDSDGDKAIGA